MLTETVKGNCGCVFMCACISICVCAPIYTHMLTHTQVNVYTGMSCLFDVSVRPGTVRSEPAGCACDVAVTQDHSLDGPWSYVRTSFQGM